MALPIRSGMPTIKLESKAKNLLSVNSVITEVQIRPLVQRLFNSNTSHKRKQSMLSKKEDISCQHYKICEKFEIEKNFPLINGNYIESHLVNNNNNVKINYESFEIKNEHPDCEQVDNKCESKASKCEYFSGIKQEPIENYVPLQAKSAAFEEIIMKDEYNNRANEAKKSLEANVAAKIEKDLQSEKASIDVKQKTRAKRKVSNIKSKAVSIPSLTIPEELSVGVIDRRYTVEPISEEELLKLGGAKYPGKNRRQRHRCRSYHCKDCREIMPSFKALREHAIIHQIETRHKCTACSKCFTRAHDLVLHARVHSGERPYVCQFCNKGFSQKINMIRHERIHTNERPFICAVCDEGFIDQGDLAKHSRNHTGKLPYFCIICKQRFSHLEEMKEHTAKSHVGGKNYPCTVCGTVFSSRTLKKDHCLAEHSDGKPFECHDCGKKFKLKVHIIKHVNVHMGLRHHACSYCNKRFTCDSGLRLHLQRHVGIKPQACPHCPLTFYNVGTLKRHMRTHIEGRPFPCDECHLTFKSQDSRRRHVKMVHRRSLKKYRCEFEGCNEVYSVKSNMQRHLRSFHYGMKPYACDLCDACFTSKSSLVSHSSSRHSNARDYPCETCGKEFADRTSLSRHVRKIHKSKKPTIM